MKKQTFYTLMEMFNSNPSPMDMYKGGSEHEDKILNDIRDRAKTMPLEPASGMGDRDETYGDEGDDLTSDVKKLGESIQDLLAHFKKNPNISQTDIRITANKEHHDLEPDVSDPQVVMDRFSPHSMASINLFPNHPDKEYKSGEKYEYEGIDDEKRRAIYNYTASSKSLNRYLPSNHLSNILGNPIPFNDEKRARWNGSATGEKEHHISQYLQDHRLPADIVTFSGLSRHPHDYRDVLDSGETTHYMRHTGEEGVPIHFPSYTSTSSDTLTAHSFAARSIGDDDRGHKHVAVFALPKGSPVVGIGDTSKYMEENEFLIHRGMSGKVSKKPIHSVDDGSTTIHYWLVEPHSHESFDTKPLKHADDHGAKAVTPEMHNKNAKLMVDNFHNDPVAFDHLSKDLKMDHIKHLAKHTTPEQHTNMIMHLKNADHPSLKFGAMGELTHHLEANHPDHYEHIMDRLGANG